MRRWVKVQLPEALEALRAHLEALDLEAQLRSWGAEARRLVFPSTRGRILGYGIFRKRVWVPVLAASKLPYRSPHALRHTYATWMLENGAGLRYVRDQLGHASIEETEGTYGHLERRRHEAHDLSGYLHSGSSRQSASALRPTEAKLSTNINAVTESQHSVEQQLFRGALPFSPLQLGPEDREEVLLGEAHQPDA